jgi:hypothetical protein
MFRDIPAIGHAGLNQGTGIRRSRYRQRMRFTVNAPASCRAIAELESVNGANAEQLWGATGGFMQRRATSLRVAWGKSGYFVI